MVRNNRCLFLVITVVVLIFLLVLHAPYLADLYMRIFPDPCLITKEAITVQSNYQHIANERQYAASVQMFAWDEKLYFYQYKHYVLDRTAYYRRLCVFENGAVTKLTPQLNGRLLGMRNGDIYYEKLIFGSDDMVPDKTHIYCYNANTGRNTLMLECEHRVLWEDVFFSDTNSLIIRTGDCREIYYSLQGEMAQETDLFADSFVLGDKFYTVEDDSIISYDLAGNSESVLKIDPVSASFGVLNIIPCESGLIIYNEGCGDLLFYISESTMEIEELFSFPCSYSESAVNVFENYVYVSFSRYEYLPNIPYENDSMEGTYRINLQDHSVQKISNKIYNGLYIFDDTGIYACDGDCNIYKLDFDGNVIITLLHK